MLRKPEGESKLVPRAKERGLGSGRARAGIPWAPFRLRRNGALKRGRSGNWCRASLAYRAEHLEKLLPLLGKPAEPNLRKANAQSSRAIVLYFKGGFLLKDLRPSLNHRKRSGLGLAPCCSRRARRALSDESTCALASVLKNSSMSSRILAQETWADPRSALRPVSKAQGIAQCDPEDPSGPPDDDFLPRPRAWPWSLLKL